MKEIRSSCKSEITKSTHKRPEQTWAQLPSRNVIISKSAGGQRRESHGSSSWQLLSKLGEDGGAGAHRADQGGHRTPLG